MTKLGAAFWIGLVLASGFATYKVKHAVQDIDDRLTRVRKQILADQQEIRVLTAEWTYLNQPERLSDLNKTFLQLSPVTPRQLQMHIADLPWRTPPATPEMLVAAAPQAPQPAPAAPAVAAAGLAAGPASIPPGAVQLAKATPATLDALIAQLVETR
jgi:hypothetical protein